MQWIEQIVGNEQKGWSTEVEPDQSPRDDQDINFNRGAKSTDRDNDNDSEL